MFNDIPTSDFIAAAGRLYQYIQNKRYHVVNNPLNTSDQIGNIALRINQPCGYCALVDFGRPL